MTLLWTSLSLTFLLRGPNATFSKQTCGNKVLLEHRIDIALAGRNRYINTIIRHDPKLVAQTKDHFQRRRFAATGWDEHGKELAASDREIDVADGNKIATPFAEMIQLNDVRRHPRDSPVVPTVATS